MHVKYREVAAVADHMNEIQGIVDQSSGMGINFDDEVLVLMVHASLLVSWEIEDFTSKYCTEWCSKYGKYQE